MNFKMTRQRKEILNVLTNNNKPLTVEMIYDKLLDKSINLSTVYRSIDLFLFHGLISRVYLDNLSYYYYNKKDHIHYMICEKCHQMIEINCLANQFKDVLEAYNFKHTHHDLVIFGLCNNCNN